MKRLFIIVGLLLAVAAPCFAGFNSGSFGGPEGFFTSKPASVPSYTGPGDVVSGADAFWGLRGYNAAYSTGSNPAAIVCNQTTFTICSTINILSNGKFDTATASGSSACATTCVVKQLYDQTGNAHHLTCASGTACPVLTFNCINTTLPCLTFAGAQTMTVSAAPTQAQPWTMTLITERTANFTTEMYPLHTADATTSDLGIRFTSAASSVAGQCSSTVAPAGGSVADSAWHNFALVCNGASSAIYVDAGSTTASGGTSALTNTKALAIGENIFGSTPLTGGILEAGIWGAGFNSTQAGNMNTNQSNYWGS